MERAYCSCSFGVKCTQFANCVHHIHKMEFRGRFFNFTLSLFFSHSIDDEFATIIRTHTVQLVILRSLRGNSTCCTIRRAVCLWECRLPDARARTLELDQCFRGQLPLLRASTAPASGEARRKFARAQDVCDEESLRGSLEKNVERASVVSFVGAEFVASAGWATRGLSNSWGAQWDSRWRLPEGRRCADSFGLASFMFRRILFGVFHKFFQHQHVSKEEDICLDRKARSEMLVAASLAPLVCTELS